MIIHSSHGLRGLGTALTPAQILQTALNAGFDPATATQMTAIALRESSGNPNAYNGGNPPGAESSYGLWQINIQGNPTLMNQLGITDPSQLYNPATNAQAAYLLYNNNPSNLNVAWYINQPGYSQAYQAQLPTAEAAAEQVLGSNPLADSGTDSSTGSPTTSPTLSSLDFPTALSSIASGNIDLTDPTTLLILGLGMAAVYFLAARK